MAESKKTMASRDIQKDSGARASRLKMAQAVEKWRKQREPGKAAFLFRFTDVVMVFSFASFKARPAVTSKLLEGKVSCPIDAPRLSFKELSIADRID